MNANFNCPRTCPKFERQDICRFQPVFVRLGSVIVNSHTATVRVEYRDPDALRRAVEAIGGHWIGHGTHALYGRNRETGLAFHLSGWGYPVILRDDQTLAFDTFGGGNQGDLERLKAKYAIAVARSAAEAQGWMAQEETEGLRLYHPDGGTLLVRGDGSVEAFGFEGCGCHDAVSIISNAIGKPVEMTPKAEMFAERAHIKQTE